MSAGFPAVSFGRLAAHILAAAAYSFFLNTSVFLIPVMCCFVFRNTGRAVAGTAFLSFVLALYLGYGLMLGLPVKFLPVYQIRDVIMRALRPSWECGISGAACSLLLFLLSWGVFKRCEVR